MLNSILYDSKNETISKTLPNQRVSAVISDKDSLWVDAIEPDEAEVEELQRTFSLHPLAVKAVLRPQKNPTPKAEIFGSSIFMRWYCVKKRGKKTDFAPLNIFVGQNYLITIRSKGIEPVDDLYELVRSSGVIKEGSAKILYRLLDALVDGFFPLLDEITDRIDFLEDAMFEKPSKEQLRELFDYKHVLLAVHKILAPQRETINIITKYGTSFSEPDLYPYFIDIYDHLVQLGDIVDTCRDVINGAMDIYLSTISNRLNDVMRRLTLVATIFLPLTLVTGIFGMNLSFVEHNNAAFAVSLVASLAFMLFVIMEGRKL